MGFSLSWAVIRGSTREAVHDLLALRGTGKHEEIPESDITDAQLPDGSYLILANRDCLELTEEEVLRRLSTVGELVMCFVEEHVMCSFAACWRGGRQIWSIYHDAHSGRKQLEIEGDPPSPFVEIRDRLSAQQEAAGGRKAEVDYMFDVPVELAHALTGYRHDQEVAGLAGQAFEVLVRTSTQAHGRSWWKALLGI